MKIMHWLLVCLLVAGTLGADVVLGPEEVLSPPPFPAPSFSLESSPRIASNGRDYLAVWYVQGSGLYSLRFDKDGGPAETYAHRFFDITHDFRDLAIASNGTDYVVAWTTSTCCGGLGRWMHLDENGRAVAPPHTEHGWFSGVSIASNGITYALALGRAVRLLDGSGTFLRVIGGGEHPIWSGTYGDDRYQLLDLTTEGLRLYTPTAQPNVVTRVDLEGSLRRTNQTASAVAVSETQLFIAIGNWRADIDQGVLQLILADRAGRVSYIETLPKIDARRIAVGWDGSSFLVSWWSVEGTLSALRVRPDGSRDAVPFLLSRSAESKGPSIASNAIVWSEKQNAVARFVTSFDELLEPKDPVVLSLGPSANVAPRIARSGEHELITWVSHGQQRIEGTLDGRAVVLSPFREMIGRTAIAGGAKDFAVAWFERHDATRMNLYVTRIAFDGTVAPRKHVGLYRFGSFAASLRPGLAFGGSEYLIAVPDMQNLHLVRMRESGALSFERRVEVTGWGAETFSPSVVWNGQDFVIAHFTLSDVVLAGAPILPTIELKLHRARERQPVTLIRSGAFPEFRLALAAGPDRLTLISNWSSIPLVQRELDLSVPPAWRETSVPLEDAKDMEIVWNGSEYVAVWDQLNGPLLGMRFNARGEMLDSDPLTIAEDAFDPSIVVTAEGVRIVYSRSDLRVYSKTLARIPSGPRLRAVRR